MRLLENTVHINVTFEKFTNLELLSFKVYSINES